MTGQDMESDKGGSELVRWFAGRRTEFERWVEETSNTAVNRVRTMLAEEIRALARRVERMHEILDQLEQLVDSTSEERIDSSEDREGST